MKTRLDFALDKKFEGIVDADLLYNVLSSIRSLAKDQSKKDRYSLLFEKVEDGSTRFVFHIHQVAGTGTQQALMFDEKIEEDDNIAAIIIRVFKLMQDPGVSNEFIAELDAKHNLGHIISAFSTAYSLRCGFYFKAYGDDGEEIDHVEFDYRAVDELHFKLKQFKRPDFQIVEVEGEILGATIGDKKLQIKVLNKNKILEKDSKVWIKYEDILHDNVLNRTFGYNDRVIASVEIKPNKHKKILNMIHADESKRII